MSEPRKPDHLVTAFGSQVVHAAHDIPGAYHVLACNGRAVQGFANTGTPEQVTCKACLKALNTGRAEWQ